MDVIGILVFNASLMPTFPALFFYPIDDQTLTHSSWWPQYGLSAVSVYVMWCGLLHPPLSSLSLSVGIKMGGWWGSDGRHWPVQGQLWHWSDMGNKQWVFNVEVIFWLRQEIRKSLYPPFHACVCLWYCFIVVLLKSLLSLHNSCSDLKEVSQYSLSAVSEQSLSSLWAVSEQSLNSLWAVSEQSLSSMLFLRCNSFNIEMNNRQNF